MPLATLALLAATLGAPAPVPPQTGPREPACVAPTWDLGPRQAPRVVHAYLDPNGVGALTTWLQLRRLVADHGGRVRVSVRLVRGDALADPNRAGVRRWALAAAQQDRLPSVLRQLDRDGPVRTHARLADPVQREQLERDLKLDAERLARDMADPCVETILRASDAGIPGLGSNRGPRPPLFSIDGAPAFPDASNLEHLRSRLGGETARDPVGLRSKRPRPFSGVSVALVRPDIPQGATLGGIGLPHRLLVTARGEDDPSVFLMLAPVMRFTARNPAVVSIQIVARGRGLPTRKLRGRLCAARELGLELPYFKYLATQPASRRGDDDELLAALDAVVEELPCEEERDAAAESEAVPEGTWLDGIPRIKAELEQIQDSLQALDRSRRPLDAVLGPAVTP